MPRRTLLADGISPSENRKATKSARADRAANSFEVVGREWFAKHSPNWAASHASKVEERLERDVYPWLGGRPIAEITAPELLKMLRRIEGRGAVDTVHHVKGDCSRIFRYAIATGRAERDPAADLRGALPPVKGQHFASIVEPAAIGGLLRAMDGFMGSFVVQCALRAVADVLRTSW